MSREVISWLLNELGISLRSFLTGSLHLNRRSYMFIDDIEDFLFWRLVELYRPVGSVDACKELRRVLEEELKDEERRIALRSLILQLIQEYMESQREEEEDMKLIRIKRKKSEEEAADIYLYV